MNSKAYHETADRALARASYDPRRLVLIHMGVTCLLSALLLLLDFLLEKGIGSTASGLSGMGSRAVLSTVQSLLQSLQMAFLPFWSVGYTYATNYKTPLYASASASSAEIASLDSGVRVVVSSVTMNGSWAQVYVPYLQAYGYLPVDAIK